MSRISILGDSNSTSYLEDENKNYLTPMNELYSYHLTNFGYDVIPMAFVSNDTRKILNRSNFFIKNANSEIFIIQIGWIDSSPRIVPLWLDYIIKLNIKGTKKFVQKLISKNRYYYKKNYVPLISLNDFSKNLVKIIELIQKHNQNSEIIFLTIPYSLDDVINEQRKKYNEKIKKIAKQKNCKFYDAYELTKDSSMLNKSGHYSSIAHKIIAEKINEIIKS